MEVAKGLNVELRLSGRFEQTAKSLTMADNLFRSAQMAIPTYSMYANDNPDYWGAVGDMANPVHVSDSDDSGYEDRLRREFNSSLAVTWQLPWDERAGGESIGCLRLYEQGMENVAERPLGIYV